MVQSLSLFERSQGSAPFYRINAIIVLKSTGRGHVVQRMLVAILIALVMGWVLFAFPFLIGLLIFFLVLRKLRSRD